LPQEAEERRRRSPRKATAIKKETTIDFPIQHATLSQRRTREIAQDLHKRKTPQAQNTGKQRCGREEKFYKKLVEFQLSKEQQLKR